MGKIKKFKLHWADAWGIIGDGYDSTVEITEDGKTVLLFLVNMKPTRINLGDREDEFIIGIKESGIQTIDGRNFDDKNMLDGDSWNIDIIADGLEVSAKGHGVFPKELERFLEYLHKEWHLPICNIAKQYYHKRLS